MAEYLGPPLGTKINSKSEFINDRTYLQVDKTYDLHNDLCYIPWDAPKPRRFVKVKITKRTNDIGEIVNSFDITDEYGIVLRGIRKNTADCSEYEMRELKDPLKDPLNDIYENIYEYYEIDLPADPSSRVNSYFGGVSKKRKYCSTRKYRKTKSRNRYSNSYRRKKSVKNNLKILSTKLKTII
jgi:hypothetical protein